MPVMGKKPNWKSLLKTMKLPTLSQAGIFSGPLSGHIINRRPSATCCQGDLSHAVHESARPPYCRRRLVKIQPQPARGFALIELLVVIAILAAMLLPALAAAKARAQIHHHHHCYCG